MVFEKINDLWLKKVAKFSFMDKVYLLGCFVCLFVYVSLRECLSYGLVCVCVGGLVVVGVCGFMCVRVCLSVCVKPLVCPLSKFLAEAGISFSNITLLIQL